MRRDSGPAIVAGAVFAGNRGSDPIVVALAADHVVTDPVALPRSAAAAAAAERPHRDFWRAADAPGDRIRLYPDRRRDRPRHFRDRKFVEKPDAKTAERYVAEGYLWNSGNFMFRADFLLDEFRSFEPQSAAAVTEAVAAAGCDLGFVTLDAQAFARATAKSIDYAVMERTKRAAVLPVAYGWSDVGSWRRSGNCRGETRTEMPRGARPCFSTPAVRMSRPRSSW